MTKQLLSLSFSSSKSFKPYIVGLSLFILFIIAGIITLPDYGISWDAGFRMMRGQGYANLYLNNKLRYGYPPRISPVLIRPNELITRFNNSAWEGDIKKTDLPNRPLPQTEFKNTQTHLKTSFYQSDDWSPAYFVHSDGAGHLPLIDILAAFSNRFFYQTLNLFGDIESYQLIYLIAAAVGVFVVSVFTYQITNSHYAAAIAGFSLALFPLFLGDSHINMKDPIQASFYAGAIWGFWNWIKTNQLRWFVIFGTFVSLALGVKWNIVFLPFVFLPWMLTILKTSELKHWFRVKKLLFLSTLLLVTCAIFLILIWPNSWSNPIQSLAGVVQFYWDTGTSNNYIQPDGFIGLLGLNFYPLALFFTQTPEITLFLVLAGTIFGLFVKNRDDHIKTPLLIILWAFEPLLRLTLPHVRDLLGLRQIMEMLPGLAVLAGMGFWYLMKVTRDKLGNNKFKNNLLIVTTTLLVTIFLTIPVIKLHPNENTYFNIFTGGLNGAVNNNLVDWTLTYGNAYKQAADWLNKHAEPNATVALLDGSNFALSSLWLRDDISFSPNNFSAFDQKGEYLIYPLDAGFPAIFAVRYPERVLNPVGQIKVDGVPLLTIYKNSPEFVKTGYKDERLVQNATVQMNATNSQKLLELNLGSDQTVTRVEISGADKSCLKPFFNDLVTFQPAAEIVDKGLNVKVLYPIQETKVLDNGNIEYFFPAEKSRYLTIILGTPTCFASSKIRSIKAVL